MAKTTKAKSLHPAPVYQAEYPGGRVVRMSFWQAFGKPIDAARGKALCDAVLASEVFAAQYCPEETDRRAKLAAAESAVDKAEIDYNVARDRWYGCKYDDPTEEALTAKRDAEKAREDAYKARDALRHVAVEAMEDRLRAETEFRRAFIAPDSVGLVFHPSWGMKAAADCAPVAARKVSAASILAKIKATLSAPLEDAAKLQALAEIAAAA